LSSSRPQMRMLVEEEKVPHTNKEKRSDEEAKEFSAKNVNLISVLKLESQDNRLVRESGSMQQKEEANIIQNLMQDKKEGKDDSEDEIDDDMVAEEGELGRFE